MKHILVRGHQGVSWLILGGLVLQFFLAGLGLFGDVGLDPHRIFGMALVGLALLNMVLALAGRVLVWRSSLLFGLMLVQVLLIWLGEISPLIPALHPVNAIALVYVAQALVRASRPIAPEVTRQPALATR